MPRPESEYAALAKKCRAEIRSMESGHDVGPYGLLEDCAAALTRAGEIEEAANRVADAARAANAVCEDQLKDIGPREHDVGICVCGLISNIKALADALRAFDALEGGSRGK